MSRIASNGMHHASLLIGGSVEAESYVRSLCDSLDIKLANNPDFFVFRAATFGIDEARELKSMSACKAFTPRLPSGQAGRKIFLITSARLTHEAQNALLKTFEDPFPDTHFFLATREEALILPTLRSRMEVLHIQNVQSRALDSEAQEFLTLSLKDRLLFAKKFIDEEKGVSFFLDNLLLLLRRRGAAEHLLESVYRIRRFADDTAAAPRLMLEHLALVLP